MSICHVLLLKVLLLDPDRARHSHLFLRGGLFVSFSGRFGGEVYDLTAFVPAAIHADGMALVLDAAIGAFGSAGGVERVMRSSVISV